MKFSTVIAVLAAVTAAAAVPVAREASPALELRDLAPEVDVRDSDAAALSHLVSRGFFEADELEERGFLSSLFGGSKSALKVTFTDPTGPVSAARQAASIKLLNKAVSKANQAKFPFCSVAFGATGNAATFRCFSSAAKKIGQQGPAGAINPS
ncbi:hypothetical protein C8F04DRAFT_1181223 [Mycena alexandri]|uniref:Uncharacterized protein n=1 Tax=Mycena alexandri TaxID=1745969 RepID=A0AAD6X8Z0_9AGAR|nr:hypothetical protein C8F04DRAFT_1181223 [Mycena alexandri]